MSDAETVRLEIHPGAAEKYNRDAEALLFTTQVKPAMPLPPSSSFVPDIPVKAVIRSEDMSDFQTMSVGPNGKHLSRLFLHDGKEVGFEGDAYKNFIRFCEEIQKRMPFSQYISLHFFENIVFDWLKERYCGTTSQTLTEYLIPKCESEIREVEVWIPISYTSAQAEFNFADLTIKSFSQAMFENLRGDYQAIDMPEEDRAGRMAILDHYQQEVGGLAAATMFVTAEPHRAYEIASDQAEKAVALFRIFSKATFIPEVSSCTALYGQKTAQSKLYFVFHEGGMRVHSSEGAIIQDVPFYITNEHLQMWSQTGMRAFANLFFNDSRTPFEDNVFQSLMIYSRSTLTTNASDKLMYVFSALEALLVRDANENLQQNVGDRIAYLTAKEAKERRQIVSNYKAAYKLRSSYVHHGHTVSEMETLNTFYPTVFQFFLNVVHLHLSHKTKDTFLSAIEDIKYS